MVIEKLKSFKQCKDPYDSLVSDWVLVDEFRPSVEYGIFFPDAQKRLAAAQYEFIKDIAFADDEGTKTRLVEFDLQRPAETPDGVEIIDTHVQAPFLGLVPIPSLLVEDVNIEFQMEVSATESTKSTTSAEASTKVEGSHGFLVAKVKVEVQGKVSSSRENTRSTNQTAKYQVRVVARQQ
jgi:hypothetical protein